MLSYSQGSQGKMQPEVTGEDNDLLTLNQRIKNHDSMSSMSSSNLDRIPQDLLHSESMLSMRSSTWIDSAVPVIGISRPGQSPGARVQRGNHMKSMHIKIHRVGIGLAQIDKEMQGS